MSRNIVVLGSLCFALISYLSLILISLGVLEHIEYIWGIPINNIYIFTPILFGLIGVAISLLGFKYRMINLILINTSVLIVAVVSLIIAIV
ncbi:hypothetical protein ACFSTA_02125 [Ornithinibacillus salinisoli]|uniref:Uncharacterized protein n=1 Tax=Ornithinibacillus salinisoli TaxID=1848459 RepID=A0ABW4VX14_9BACI